MPWHDVALKVIGSVAQDLALHFIELWNHVMTDITGGYTKNKDLLEVNAYREEAAAPEFSSVSVEENLIDDFIKHEEIKISEPIYEEMKEQTKKMPLITISAPTEKSVKGLLEIPEVRMLPRSHTGDTFLRRELTGVDRKVQRTSSLSHFSRIDVVGLNNKLQLNSEDMIYNATVIPKASTNPIIKQMVSNNLPKEIDDHLMSPFRQKTGESFHKPAPDKETREKLEFEDEQNLQRDVQNDLNQGDKGRARRMLRPSVNESDNLGTCDCQIIRSAGLWSLGLQTTEHSIHMAYLSLIDKADHFIYIENQFFISSTAGSPVKNQIAQALVDRIKIAAERKENFKVIVVCPLLPGFEGGIEDSGSAVLRLQLHWEYQTITRGTDSIYEQLLKDPNIRDPLDYIRFYGLRNHAILGGTPVTEIVYVHSKLMIVDDDIVLMGSANINDRSQLGVRDSEIAMVINDTERITTVIDGHHKRVSKFASTLRLALFKELLGTDDERILRDPLSSDFTKLWTTTAETNTALYREIFACYPDDNILAFNNLAGFQEKSNLSVYSTKKDLFKGFLVQFPLNFLANEDLKLTLFNKKSILTKEFIIPQESFV